MEKKFKIRASASGNLMTNPRRKKELISKTTISYLHEWYKEQLYGVKKEISSKYLTKGNEKENEAIDKVIDWLDIPFGIKNEKNFEDEFFTGTPDLIVDDVVYDTKCSWDCFTFPLFDEEIKNKDYYYQLQVYMHLTGCKKAVLAYVLLNTPEHITWEQKHEYDDLPKHLRMNQFTIDYDEEIINELPPRVVNCREYLETIKIK